MSNINSVATVTVRINGQEAANTLDSLRNKAQVLRTEIDKAEKNNDKANAGKLRRELKRTEDNIKAIESSLQSTKQTLVNLDKASPKDLNKALKTLKSELDKTERGSQKWVSIQNKIRAVKNELSAINSQQMSIKQLRQTMKSLDSASPERLSLALKTLSSNLHRLRQGSAEFNRTKAMVDKVKAAIDKLNGKAMSTKNVMKVVANNASASFNDLSMALQRIEQRMRSLSPQSKLWQIWNERAKILKERMQGINSQMSKMKKSESLWGRFARKANDWGTAIMGIVAGLTGIIAAGRNAVKVYASMEEHIANTRKYTRMSEEDVRDLNDAFLGMDTRLGREQLNLLAQEAGRLGKNTIETVKGYVDAAQVINVALVDLGEGATQTIAKIANIFGIEEIYGIREAMLKVGSTVNHLSQNCTASKPYIVEFSKRMAGIGSAAKMSIADVIAFGATLDSCGQKVEMSAGALSRLTLMLYQKPKEMAKILGLDAELFAKTMHESTTKGIVLFLDKLRELGGEKAIDKLAPMFQDLGIDGIRLSQVVTALATHLEMLKWQLGEAAQAFREGTSATKEFKIFNNTAQATIDKAKARFKEMVVELGEKLYPVMKHVYTAGSLLMRTLKLIVDFVVENKKVIILLTAAYIGFKAQVIYTTVALKTYRIVMYACAAGSKTLHAATCLLQAAMFLLGGNIRKASVCWSAFSKVVKVSWIGMVAAGIMGIVAAITLLNKGIDKEAKVHKILGDAKKKAQEESAKESSLLDLWYKRSQDATISINKRKDAAQSLIDLFPETFKCFSKEEILLGKAKSAYDGLRDSLIKLVEVESYRNELSTLSNEKVKKQIELSRKIEYVKMNGNLPKELQDIAWDFYDDNSNLVNALNTWLEKENKAEVFRYNPGGIANKNAAAKSIIRQMLELKKEIDTYEEAMQKIADHIDYANRPIESIKDGSLGDEEYENDVKVGSGGNGIDDEYESQKSKRARELEQKRELAKLKANFKQRALAIKADMEKFMANIIVEYAAGNLGYEDFLEAKEKSQLDYLDKMIGLYQSVFKNESKEMKGLLLNMDEDYQELLMKRADLGKNIAERSAKFEIEDLKKSYERDLFDLQMKFSDLDNGLFGKEKAQQEAIFQLKMKYLRLYANAYNKDSKERLEYEKQIVDAERSKMLERKKFLSDKAKEMKEEYSFNEMLERIREEFDLLEQLHFNGLISDDVYEKKRNRIESVDLRKAERPTELGGVIGSFASEWGFDSMSDKTDEVYRQLNKTIYELNKNLAEGKISANEYANEVAKAEREFESNLKNMWTSHLDQQTSSVAAIAIAWTDLFNGIKENGKLSLESVADAAAATLAVMSSALSMYSDFARAENEKQIALIEKKYDVEINRASGNSYKVARLEKQKENDLARVKQSASNRDFELKIVQSVAQTAMNALYAYGAGLQAGFPMALWLAPSLAAIATAMGVAQVALIKQQKAAANAKGYSAGGYTKKGPKDEPAGIVHAGEWVASQKLVNHPATSQVIKALDFAQKTNTIGAFRTGSEHLIAQSVRTREVERTAAPTVVVADDGQRTAVAIEKLVQRLNEPFVTVNTIGGDKGIKEAWDNYDKLMRNKSKR